MPNKYSAFSFPGNAHQRRIAFRKLAREMDLKNKNRKSVAQIAKEAGFKPLSKQQRAIAFDLLPRRNY